MEGTSGSDLVCDECPDGYDYDEDYDDYPEHPGYANVPLSDFEPSPEDFCDSNLIEMYTGIMSDAVREAGITEEMYVRAMPHLDDADATKRTEKDLLFAVAKILLGKGWQSKLARASGYSQGRIQQVYSDKNQVVTPKLKNAMLAAFHKEIARSDKRVARAMAGIIRVHDAKR